MATPTSSWRRIYAIMASCPTSTNWQSRKALVKSHLRSQPRPMTSQCAVRADDRARTHP